MDMHRKGTKIKPLTQITEGRQLISPIMASWILQNCFFEGQRVRYSHRTKKIHVDRHVENIRRGNWHVSVIVFATLPDGRIYLIDGYHRIEAVVEYGSAMPFMVIIESARDEGHVAELYSTYNRPGLERSRTIPQLLDALHIGEKFQVQKKIAEAAYKAVSVIDNGMKATNTGDVDSIVRMGVLEIRLDIMNQYAQEIYDFNTCLLNTDFRLKHMLLAQSIFAVALQTLRYQREKAIRFWSSVGNNDGLRVKSPEHTFLNAVRNRSFSGKNDDAIIGAALAWNAYYEGRQINSLQIGLVKPPLRLSGTSVFVGRGN